MAVSFLKSKLFITGGAVVLLLTLMFLGREIQERYRIHQEIKALRDEIVLHESQNDELLEFINYFKTPEYRERQARALLALQKEGEFAVALPTSSAADFPPPTESAAVNRMSNLRLWWEYFFAK